MSKTKLLLKILKYIWLFILSLITILLIVVFISKQSLYKESDFNIPEDFFDTIYSDKDENSEENWFIDLLDLIEKLNNNVVSSNLYEDIDLEYYSSKYKDLINNFNSKKLNDESKITKEKDKLREEIYREKKDYLEVKNELEKHSDKYFLFKFLQNYKTFDNEIKIIDDEKYNELSSLKSLLEEDNLFKNVYSSDFLKVKQEYIGMNSENINFTGLPTFFRSLNYLSILEFENWNYDSGIDLILENQKFIDFMLNNSDVPTIFYMVFMKLNNYSNDTLNYVLDNYKLDKKYLDELNIYFEDNELYDGILKNSIKHDLKPSSEAIDLLDEEEGSLIYLVLENSIKEKLFFEDFLMFLFYNEEETLLLNKKIYYDSINLNEEHLFESMDPYKLANILWRGVLIDMYSLYESQFEKKDKMFEDREKLKNMLSELLESKKEDNL